MLLASARSNLTVSLQRPVRTRERRRGGARQLRAASEETEVTTREKEDPREEASYVPHTTFEKFSTRVRLSFALPWRRFKSGSVLTFDISDEIRELPPPAFSKDISLPNICDGLIKAAYDPRIKGIFVKISPIESGWAKLTEIRRHVSFFNASGKFSVAYVDCGGEKEYYVASAFREIYVPPSANVYLKGLAFTGMFLRGALDKAGIEPQVVRIGDYKSAGDQLLREEMSEYQKEQLQALLDDIYQGFTEDVAESREMTVAGVEKALNEGYIDMADYKKAGFFTDVKYRDEVVDMLKDRLDIKKKKDKLKRVSLRKYKSVSRSAFGLDRGNKKIAIVRASGAIGDTQGLPTSDGIRSKDLIREIRRSADRKDVAAIVLRIDSPGGAALTSDLIWREIQKISEEKPIIASMADVAASGGYYLAMGARKIVAERMTLTGSIGVVLTKIGLGELYKRIGVSKETVSKGRFAELFLDNRSFTDDEDAYWTKLADYAYVSFRDKAAESRGLTPEEMQECAQGRVWSGKRALDVGLVDALGGIHTAIQLAKEAADLTGNVRTFESSKYKGTPLDVIKAASLTTNGIISAVFLAWGMFSFTLAREGFGIFNAVVSILLGGAGLLSLIPQSDDDLWEYTMDDIETGPTGMRGSMPQAMLDIDDRFLGRVLEPSLKQLLKRWL